MDENRNRVLTSIFERQLGRFGKDVYINGGVAKCIPYKEESKIKMGVADGIQLYTPIELDGVEYLITDREQIEDVCINYMIERLYHTLKVKYEGMDMILLPSKVKDISNNIKYSEVVNVDEFKVEVYTKLDKISRAVGRGTRIMIFDFPYKVINLTWENGEILKLTCESDSFNDEDDKENGICYNPTNPNVYYDLNVISVGEHGQIKPLKGSYKNGAKVTFTIIPDNDYVVDTFIINGTIIDLQGALTYDYTISSDTNVSITFKETPKQYLINVIATNCSVTPSNVYVLEGNNQTFTITPNTNYIISSVKLDGADVTSQLVGNAFTINGCVTQHTLEVECVLDATPELKIVPEVANGGCYTITKGDTVTFNVNKLIGGVDSGEKLTITRTDKISSNYCTVTINDNSFTVYNKYQYSKGYIVINITDNDTLSMTVNIELGGAW